MDEGDYAVSIELEIPPTTVHLVYLSDVPGVAEGELPIGVILHEQIAEDFKELIADRYPLPEGSTLKVKLIGAHPDVVARWAREISDGC